MSEARLHALHWAFFVDVMDMEFADLHTMFSAWCEGIPADEMNDIMALGDALFGDDDDDDNSDDDEDNGDDDGDDDDSTDDKPDTLYTEEEIWKDTGVAGPRPDFSLN